MRTQYISFKDVSASKLIAGIAIISLLAFTAFYDILSVNNAFFGEWHDVIMYHLPYLTYDGGYTLWNSLWITGFPEFAGPQLSIYYPTTALFMSLTNNIFLQADLNLIIHVIILLITMNLFLSLFTNKYKYSFIFSMLFMFTACMTLRISAGHELIVCAISWIPLLYYSFGRFLFKNDYSLLNNILIAASILLIFFTGAVYYAAYACIFLAIFAIYALITKHMPITKYILLGISAIICVLISAIKLIPLIEITPYLTRVDGAVDVFGGGGSLESNLASFLFGTPINQGYAYTGLQYGAHESAILIGIVIIFLCILGFVYGKRQFTIPAFLSIVFALIWADAGKTIFSFIHLLPFLDSFRCPGRIFGALLPLIIALSLYGFLIISKKIHENQSFKLDDTQKKCLLYGIAIVIFLKLVELPYQEGLTTEAILSLIIVAAFVGVIALNKLNKNAIIGLFAAGFIINAVYIALNYTFSVPSLLKTIVLSVVVIGLLGYEIKLAIGKQKDSDTLLIKSVEIDTDSMLLVSDKVETGDKNKSSKKSKISSSKSSTSNKEILPNVPIKQFDKSFAVIAVITVLSIILVCAAGFTYLKPVTPEFEKSPANAIIEEFAKYPTENAQAWAVTTGWAFKEMDYTYLFMTNGIHSAGAYNGYYLDTMLPIVYNIGDKPYFITNYVIDTNYLNTGTLALENYTFMTEGVPVTIPEYVFPNAFTLRGNDEIIKPTSYEKFTPDAVIIKGDFKKDDVAVLKTAYYKGWTINGVDGSNVGNMVGTEVKSDTDRIVFKFAPKSFTIGLVLTIMGLIALIGAIVFRKRIEEMIG